MAGKKKGNARMGHAASKTQKLVAPCGECGTEVEVQRVLVVGKPSRKTWWCKSDRHESIDATKVRTA